MKIKIILLVGNNPDDIMLTIRALKKSNIVNEIIDAQNGVEALDNLFNAGQFTGRDTNVKPQVILLDLKMPRIEGLEFLRRIRADERVRLLLVIVITYSSEDRDRNESYKQGANSYFRKLVDLSQLPRRSSSWDHTGCSITKRPEKWKRGRTGPRNDGCIIKKSTTLSLHLIGHPCRRSAVGCRPFRYAGDGPSEG